MVSPKQIVKSGYNVLYDEIAERLKGTNRIDVIRSKFLEIIIERRVTSYNAFRQGRGDFCSNKALLLSALHLVTLLGSEDFRIPEKSWKIIKIACFLLSNEGMFYLRGLQLDKLSDEEFHWKTTKLTEFFKRVLKGENNSLLVQHVAESVKLMKDIIVSNDMRSFVQSVSNISHHSDAFRRNPSPYKRNGSVFKMAFPDGDVTSMTFRLLTFVMYPSDAAFCDDRLVQLARLKFVYTCKRDEIQCTRCNQKSDQLGANCDVTSHSFHFTGCPNIAEARLSRRLQSFQNFRSLPNVKVVQLAKDGLFSTGSGYEVKCFSCSKETDAQNCQEIRNSSAWHYPGCSFTPEINNDVVLRESMERLQEIKCSSCEVRSANVISIKCCHLVRCSQCYIREQPLTVCPTCQSVCEECRVLYEV